MKYLAVFTTVVLLLIIPAQQSPITHISHVYEQNLESLYGTKHDHMGSFYESSKDSRDSNQFEGQSIIRKSSSPSRANMLSISEMIQKSVLPENNKHTLPAKTQLINSSSLPSPNLSKQRGSKISPFEGKDDKEIPKKEENYQSSNQNKPFQALSAGQGVQTPNKNLIRNVFSEPTDASSATESSESSISPKHLRSIAKVNSKGATLTEGNMIQPSSSNSLLSGASKTASNQLSPPSTFKELTQSKGQNIQNQASPLSALQSSIATDSPTPFSVSVQVVNSSGQILPNSMQKPSPFSQLATTVRSKPNSSSSSISPTNQATKSTTIAETNSPFQSKSAPNGEVAESSSDKLPTEDKLVFGASMKPKKSFGSAPIFAEVERQKSPVQVPAATKVLPSRQTQQLKMPSNSASAAAKAKPTVSLALGAAGQDESTVLSTSQTMTLAGTAVSNPSTSSSSKAQHEKNVNPLTTREKTIFTKSVTSATQPAHTAQSSIRPIHYFRQRDQAISPSEKSQSSPAVVVIPIIPSKSASLSLDTGSNDSKVKGGQTNTTVASNTNKFNANSSGFATVISLSNSSFTSPGKHKNLLFWPNVESQNGWPTLMPPLLMAILLLAL